MTTKVTGAKIACLDFSLQKAKMKLGVQVLVDDPSKLEGIRQRYVTEEFALVQNCRKTYFCSKNAKCSASVIIFLL